MLNDEAVTIKKKLDKLIIIMIPIVIQTTLLKFYQINNIKFYYFTTCILFNNFNGLVHL